MMKIIKMKQNYDRNLKTLDKKKSSQDIKKARIENDHIFLASHCHDVVAKMLLDQDTISNTSGSTVSIG